MRGDFLLDPIVATFARYGLRKTSMEDVAAALGVSRQALYLRHGSKGALIGWATQGLIDGSLAAAPARIEQPAKTLPERLADASDSWVGRHIASLPASPHAPALLAIPQLHPPEAVRAA